MEPPRSALRALPSVSAKVPSSPEDVHLVRLAKDSVPAAAAFEPPPIVACITTYNESHEELQVSSAFAGEGGVGWVWFTNAKMISCWH